MPFLKLVLMTKDPFLSVKVCRITLTIQILNAAPPFKSPLLYYGCGRDLRDAVSVNLNKNNYLHA